MFSIKTVVPSRAVGWILLLLCPALFGAPRVWTNNDGKTAVAEFVSLNGETVILKKGHKTCPIQLSSLSSNDQNYIFEQVKLEKAFSNAPLQIFEKERYKGGRAGLSPHRIYSGEGRLSKESAIPNGLNKKVSSLILKKGYQVCIATTQDGVGPSKVLIANKRDIRIPKLSRKFTDSIQYFRVLPFKNPIKKGHAGRNPEGLNQGWFYTWGGYHEQTVDEAGILWTPQIFGAGMTKEEDVQQLISIRGIQEITAYNEPSQKKWGGINNPEVAVSLYKKFLGTGLRMGSINPTEHGPLKSYEGHVEGKPKQSKAGWYSAWHAEAIRQGLRQDFMCVHWYDWGGAHDTPREKGSAKDIFQRFKQYLKRVHERYDLPIWITEFNANPHCPPETHVEFAKLAFPYLDNCPYVERYTWFQPFNYDARKTDKDGQIEWDLELRKKGNANYRKVFDDPNSPLTAFGEFSYNHKSVPAMNEEVYLGKNNLYKDEVEE